MFDQPIGPDYMTAGTEVLRNNMEEDFTKYSPVMWADPLLPYDIQIVDGKEISDKFWRLQQKHTQTKREIDMANTDVRMAAVPTKRKLVDLDGNELPNAKRSGAAPETEVKELYS